MTPTTVIGASFIALQVHHLDSPAAFYERSLGLTRALESPPGALVFATSPIAVTVHEANA